MKGDKNRQAVFGDASHEAIVWTETPSSDLFQSNWRIFSSQGVGQETALIAQSKEIWDVDELQLTSGEPVPVLKDDVVHWASTSEGDGSPWGSDVVSKKIDGTGKLDVLSPLAVSPAKLDNEIAVLNLTHLDDADEDADLRLPGVPTGITLHQDDRTSEKLMGKSDTSQSDNTFGPLMRSGRTLLTEYGSDMLVINTVERSVHSISTPAGSRPVGQKMCRDFATWTYETDGGEIAGEQYFFDLGSGNLTKIPNDKLFGETECNGEYFSWSLMDKSTEGAIAYDEVLKLK